MLGYTQVAFTMQTYAHVIKEAQQQAPQVAPSEVSATVN
jgi:hypothetical protein